MKNIKTNKNNFENQENAYLTRKPSLIKNKKTIRIYNMIASNNDLKGRCLEDHERYIPQGENRCACCELIFKNGLLTSWENAYGDFDKLCPDCYTLIINDKNLNIRG